MSRPNVDHVRAPASSANLGAGFDVLGMAVTLYADVGHGDPPDRAVAIEPDHPVRTAFERLGGTGPIWLRTNIPMARGLGFSGAARAAAAGLGACGAAGGADALTTRRADILDVTAELEGHGDNAAASIAGGVTAFVGGEVTAIPLGPRLAAAEVIAWVPDATTSTDASRTALPAEVSRAAAVTNLGSVARLVAAFASDEPALLAGATVDRLHQPDRLPRVPGAIEAMDAAAAAGAWCSWLSGSGPTIAILCEAGRSTAVIEALPEGGHAKRLGIDTRGLTAIPSA